MANNRQKLWLLEHSKLQHPLLLSNLHKSADRFRRKRILKIPGEITNKPHFEHSSRICRKPLRFKYFDRELEKSPILTRLDSIVNFSSQFSNKINNSVIKIFLFNILFGCIIFVCLITILVYFGIISQSKYILDCYKNNELYGLPYQIFTLKN